ncbi:hypothetical protein [Xenorhabdus hominickii]|uniref:Uncharacterized protein n=1 Tax=Xenorhabdus hominickii TaxID=351679 RepID=A0A2G0Q130_XENHO|nr:hypothetical protein [Xenorhabdus hominickii]AOM39210.1 hypothetical protein A9255_00410 [Xenorhabdus hominickii]PHM52912.1 hypothetical protein Xhom_03794 [Xenorhabdus hominickii]
MFLQWVKRALIWMIKDIFNDIRWMASAMFGVFTLIGLFVAHEFKLTLFFFVLAVIPCSPEIWRFLKARISNKGIR